MDKAAVFGTVDGGSIPSKGKGDGRRVGTSDGGSTCPEVKIDICRKQARSMSIFYCGVPSEGNSVNCVQALVAGGEAARGQKFRDMFKVAI